MATDNIWWHGTPSGDLRGGPWGLHVGSRQAAKEALEARIGIPVQGEWDGTREYGKTLVAGRKTLAARGIYPTGYSVDVPDEDHYPPVGKTKFMSGEQVLPTHKPDLFPLRIVGPMSNTVHAPHADAKANGLMAGQMKRGTAKRGYYYSNVGEDAGSISAVVPGPDHVQRLFEPNKALLHKTDDSTGHEDPKPEAPKALTAELSPHPYFDRSPEGVGKRLHHQISNELPVDFNPNPTIHTHHSDVTAQVGNHLFEGKATAEHLYRSYKHTPHNPPSLFLKYLVHRINHIDDYDQPAGRHPRLKEAKADSLDKQFMALHQAGGSFEKNGHVTVNDLRHWAITNPHLAENLLNHKQHLQRLVKRGVGLTVRKLNGEDYVAMCRGLKSHAMKNEHALSSFADSTDTAHTFASNGGKIHFAWMPLKDLWFSFDKGPASTHGEHGPEDEYLFSNAHPRYQARNTDLSPSRLKHIRLYNREDPPRFDDSHVKALYDDATDEELASVLDGPRDHSHIQEVYNHPNAGPLTQASFLESITNQMGEYNPGPEDLVSKLLPANVAMSHFRNAAKEQLVPDARHYLDNPNITHEHIKELFDHTAQNYPEQYSSHDLARTIKQGLAHKNVDTEDFSNHVFDYINRVQPITETGIRSGITGALFEYPQFKTPQPVLDKMAGQYLSYLEGSGNNNPHSNGPKLMARISPEAAGELWDGADGYGRSLISQNSHLPDRVVDEILKNGTGRLSMGRNLNLTPEQQVKVIQNHPLAAGEMVHAATPDSDDDSGRKKVTLAKPVIDAIVEQMGNDPTSSVQAWRLARQPNFDTQHVLKLVENQMKTQHPHVWRNTIVDLANEGKDISVLEQLLPEHLRGEDAAQAFLAGKITSNDINAEVLASALAEVHYAEQRKKREAMQGHIIRPLPHEPLTKSLRKAQTPPKLPQLGIENRRETPMVTTGRDLDMKRRLMFNANYRGMGIPKSSWQGKGIAGEEFKDTQQDYVASARSGSHRGASMNAVGEVKDAAGKYQMAPPIRVAYTKAGLFSGGTIPRGTQQHEDLHGMLGRVAEKHGPRARQYLAQNLYNAIPKQYRTMVDELQHTFAGDSYEKGSFPHEEKLARLLNYANSHDDRQFFHEALGHGMSEHNRDYVHYNRGLKRALQAVRYAAETAHEGWLQPNHIKKNEAGSQTDSVGAMRGMSMPKPKKPKKAPVQDDPNLVVVHNLSGDNLLHAAKLGGLAAPSIAITHKHAPLTSFGEISMVGSHDLINPAHTPVFAADIYSPRHPRADYKLNEKAARKFHEWLHPHVADAKLHTGSHIDDQIKQGGVDRALTDRMVRTSLGLAFMREKGIPHQLPMRNKGQQYEFTSHPIMREFVAKHGINTNPDFGSDYHKALSEATGKSIDAWAKEASNGHADAEESLRDSYRELLLDNRDDDNNKGNVYFGKLHGLTQDLKNHGQTEVDGHALEKLVHSHIDSSPEFDGWAKTKLQPLEGEPYIRRISSSGNVRRVPYNIDNVLKEVTQKIRQGEDFNYGLGTARAAGAKRFKTLDQMKQARNTIVPKAEFDQHKKAMDDRFMALSRKLRAPSLNALTEAIGESYKRGKSLRRELEISGFQGLSDQDINEVQEFAKDLVNMPTEYFEAKPQRVVQLGEFKGAAVPDDAHPSILEALKAHGINHIERYKRSDSASRTDAVNRIASAQKLTLSEADHDEETDNLSEDSTVQDMHGFQITAHKAFAAARFMVGGHEPTLEAIRRAIWNHDGDMVAAALATYGLTPTDENKQALSNIMQLDSFKKSADQWLTPPAHVLAGVPEAEDTAKEVQDAYNEHHVEKVKLGGRHSAGSLLAQGPNKTHLLKPGSGGQSPAAGDRDDKSSQSRREAAFWQVARSWEIGDACPRADLIFIDGKEYAAIEMLSVEWKNVGRVEAENPNFVARSLSRYREQGALHKWAVLDFVLGNPDRHNQNLMISKDGQIKLIDHGSAFAGSGFDPANDKNSFVPWYLRSTTASFNQMLLQDKLRVMPTLNEAGCQHLQEWVHDLDPNRLATLLAEYGINPQPCLDRLDRVKALSGRIDKGINALWVMT
jgi:hypothetical protein